MASLKVAINNMKNGKTTARKGWTNGSTISMPNGTDIIRNRKNGTEAAAKLNSEDVQASDYYVVK